MHILNDWKVTPLVISENIKDLYVFLLTLMNFPVLKNGLYYLYKQKEMLLKVNISAVPQYHVLEMAPGGT